jgi:hypothetical protein
MQVENEGFGPPKKPCKDWVNGVQKRKRAICKSENSLEKSPKKLPNAPIFDPFFLSN